MVAFFTWLSLMVPGAPQEPAPSREVSHLVPQEHETTSDAGDRTESALSSSPWSLDLAYRDIGLSFGNSKRLTGLRFNARDDGVESVTGLNLTFWMPGRNPDFEMTGVAIGLVGPEVDRLSGVAVGLGAVISGEQRGVGLAGLAVVSRGTMQGIQVGGLALVSDGDLQGMSLGGLALVSDGDLQGLNVGGLATVTDGSLEGFNLGGLATVSQGSVHGINVGGVATVVQGDVHGLTLGGIAMVSQGRSVGLNVGGLATVAQADLQGIQLAGLAAVGQGRIEGLQAAGLAAVGQRGITGLTVAGLAAVSSRRMTGLQVAGLATVGQLGLDGVSVAGVGVTSSGTMRGAHVGGVFVGSDKALYLPPGFGTDEDLGSTRIRGFSLAAYRTQALEITALNLSGLVMRTNRLTGFSFSAVNTVGELQTGVTIGVFNHAENLDGVQVGLINYVPENPWPFRLLPLINLNFDREETRRPAGAE